MLAVVSAGCGEPSGELDAASHADAAVDAAIERPRWERYVRGDRDTRLVIELDAVSGAEPRAAARSELVARLTTLLDKPDGVEIVVGDAIASRGADHAWTEAELAALGAETFDDGGPEGTVTMHVMWLDGHHALDTASGAILGAAWDHRHIVMFHDSIEARCGGQPLLGDRLCAAAQYGVWLHEVGHTIGLVDNGMPMVAPHSDPEHAGHASDPECIMYWAYDSSAGLDRIASELLGGGAAADFDASCLADVAAVRLR